jgi:hypothetical protein
MALPSTGSISMNQVNVELGRGGTTQISLNEGVVRTLAQRASGQIGLSDLRGKSNTIQATGGEIREYPLNGMTYRSHTFTTVGDSTFTIISVPTTPGFDTIDYLVVGGGGSGGGAVVSSNTYSGGGGGGAGSVVVGFNRGIFSFTFPVNRIVTVGGAGAESRLPLGRTAPLLQNSETAVAAAGANGGQGTNTTTRDGGAGGSASGGGGGGFWRSVFGSVTRATGTGGTGVTTGANGQAASLNSSPSTGFAVGGGGGGAGGNTSGQSGGTTVSNNFLDGTNMVYGRGGNGGIGSSSGANRGFRSDAYGSGGGGGGGANNVSSGGTGLGIQGIVVIRYRIA